jgi:CheY-like chemotaxis protein
MSGKKILIIDDDEDMRRGLDMRLRASGYETAFATDAVSAISVANQEQPDLVLLDLGLPVGDGFVVMERMRESATLGCIPVIVLSARDPKANARRAFEEGALAFFQKPADNAELLTAIGRAVGQLEEGRSCRLRRS